jgi:hypothetical protein
VPVLWPVLWGREAALRSAVSPTRWDEVQAGASRPCSDAVAVLGRDDENGSLEGLCEVGDSCCCGRNRNSCCGGCRGPFRQVRPDVDGCRGPRYARFDRRLKTRSASFKAAAHELPRLSPRGAPGLPRLHTLNCGRFERAIIRWHGRLCLQGHWTYAPHRSPQCRSRSASVITVTERPSGPGPSRPP